ncbi:hypothetical protein CORC01_06972 [Colletotrichum orchidophilum]|uniref:Uncharacterized protein n=1 Tax=Colletotrichum orchidophilum TaxID=1209926 RepID=A0A1G4B8L4_9PEZI|nr:uncharacterized protein CORC01_06972 [Colletotrichum orchidophilum]OHE97767.1 hypothetical protein CORC01_06972 [Colletotrichum orchidophilum]
MPNWLGKTLFYFQSIAAYSIPIFKTQEVDFEWLSTVVTARRRAPWTIYAIALPFAAWTTIVLTKGIDISTAGQLTPVWISSGLISLAIYERKHRFNTALRRQKQSQRTHLAVHPQPEDSDSKKLKSDGPFDAPKANNEPIPKPPTSKSSPQRSRSKRRIYPKRSRARQFSIINCQESDLAPHYESQRESIQKIRKLWNPDYAPPSRDRTPPSKPQGSPASSRPPEVDTTDVMIKQPETRPISQEQLVAEVKGIYAGLVMVESKCIEVDNAQSSTSASETTPRLNNEQWQALIALHRTLLHEHHDFFLASQHPSASLVLRRLARQYGMPARMWHGVHSFLEFPPHAPPASLEQMFTFIYLAYPMMALLYETVPTFEDTWIECLGDLGRYRYIQCPSSF